MAKASKKAVKKAGSGKESAAVKSAAVNSAKKRSGRLTPPVGPTQSPPPRPAASLIKSDIADLSRHVDAMVDVSLQAQARLALGALSSCLHMDGSQDYKAEGSN